MEHNMISSKLWKVNILQNYYGVEKGLNFYTSNQKFAISVVGAHSQIPKYDPRYVRMIA